MLRRRPSREDSASLRRSSSLGETSKAAMMRGNIEPSQVVAVSGTSIREGFVLLDGSGREIFAVPNENVPTPG